MAGSKVVAEAQALLDTLDREEFLDKGPDIMRRLIRTVSILLDENKALDQNLQELRAKE